MIDSFRRDQFLRMNYLDRKKRFLTVFQIHEKMFLTKQRYSLLFVKDLFVDYDKVMKSFVKEKKGVFLKRWKILS